MALRTMHDVQTGELFEIDDEAAELIQPVDKRPFIDTLNRLEGGELLHELTDAQHAAVRALEERGGQAEVTLKIAYRMEGAHVLVRTEVKSKLPAADRTRSPTMFYALDGNLTRDNPRQRKLDIGD